MPSDGGLGIFVKWRENFAKLTKMPSSFVNLLEAVFCGFGKNPRMSSTFSKLLELLNTTTSQNTRESSLGGIY